MRSPRVTLGLTALFAGAAVACGGAETTPIDNDASITQVPDGAVIEAGSPPEAGPGGNTTAVACGTVLCPKASAVCCAYPSDGGTGFSYTCVGGITCPVGTVGDGGTQTPTVLGCTSSANCAQGTVCCAHPNDANQGAQSTTSLCKATCGPDEAQLCDPKAPSTGCPPSAPCSSDNIGKWELPNTFATCGGVPPPG